MSNKQFEWTDGLVGKAIKQRLLTLHVGDRSTTYNFIQSFKTENKPKPLHTTTDGVDLYSADDEVYFRGGTRLRVGSLHAQSLIGRGLPFFSSLKAVEVYNNLHEKRFSLADVQYLLTRSSYGNQFIDSVIEALTKYDKK